MKHNQSVKQIRLRKGKEIRINGYVIRATGLDDRKPESLCVYRPNTFHVIESQRKRSENVYAGYCDNIVCTPVLSIGTVGDLAESNGWTDAVAKAKHYLAKENPYDQ